MKLNLVLLALVQQQALCAQRTLDPAELQASLQSKRLDAWVESVAARRNISKETVRANVQAITFHPDSAGKDPGSAGGQHAKVERSAAEFKIYPQIYGNEDLNDGMTNHRLLRQHVACRRKFPNPAGTRFVPKDGVHSFWRAVGGHCIDEDTVQIDCKMPDEFGPHGWNWDHHDNYRRLTVDCPGDKVCNVFTAHNWHENKIPTWGSCVNELEGDRGGMVNNHPGYFDIYPCPMEANQTRIWDLYGESEDDHDLAWTLFEGVDSTHIINSVSATFMYGSAVKWVGKDPDFRPWLKFSKEWTHPKVRLWSLVL